MEKIVQPGPSCENLECAFQLGRLRIHWKGNYNMEIDMMDGADGGIMQVGLHCVSGVNIEPPKWRSNVFKRFRFPTPDWLEYDIVHIHNLHKPGSHDRVHKSAAAAMKG
ncbi:hypothetical protein OUZ56_026416 [Daphnia magna]|uniref:Uncharacterized protein n=1 Tax=Daphnia magna TaxID=35525 RepID=A0ABQ9ZLQ5_9CRUS|nr:hypothetical protein OUZ56_026416 [Daphnia magna]